MADIAPNVPSIVAPTNGTTLDYTVIQTFSWVFSDPDVGDTQSAFDFQYRIIGTSTWTTIHSVSPNNFYQTIANTFVAGNYEWQVRTYDSIGTVGPWTASNFFTAATTPTGLSIISPANNSTAPASLTLTWSTPFQTSYQVRRVGDISGAPDLSTIYYDTGEIFTTSTRSLVVSFPVSGRYENLQVRIKTSGLWSAWVNVRLNVSYIQPSPGTVAVVANNANGSLAITTTPATVGSGEPTPVSVDIYVRALGDPGVGIRIAAAQPPSGTFNWYGPASGITYAIRTLTTGSNGSQRWSATVYVTGIDGGAPSGTTYIKNIDGGNPSTINLTSKDGGAP